jgi:hypothetical protein
VTRPTRQRKGPHLFAPEEFGHLGQLVPAPDERGRWGWELGATQALERREPALAELKDAEGLAQVLEPVLTQVAHLDVLVEKVARCLRKQHLPAVARADAGGTVDVDADVAVLVLDWQRLAGADSDPHAKERAARVCKSLRFMALLFLAIARCDRVGVKVRVLCGSVVLGGDVANVSVLTEDSRRSVGCWRRFRPEPARLAADHPPAITSLRLLRTSRKPRMVNTERLARAQ